MEEYSVRVKREFIIESLPAPLAPADRHIQLYDNYVPGTRLRMRSERDTATGERVRRLEKVFTAETDGGRLWKKAWLVLEDEEYAALNMLRGREIRKNRYFIEDAAQKTSVDVYLGPLWGLHRATVEYTDADEADRSGSFDGALLEITGNADFLDSNLVGTDFETVRERFLKAKGR